MSTERIVVDASVADAFVEQLGRKAASLRPEIPGRTIAPRIDGQLRGRRTHRRAARRRTQQGRENRDWRNSDGAMLQPTVVDRVTSDMRL
jgi:acyl-CoA reductase-like NAD-dependent aldehyde dehydrogenase